MAGIQRPRPRLAASIASAMAIAAIQSNDLEKFKRYIMMTFRGGVGFLCINYAKRHSLL